jgi:hypothetical protein
MKNIGKNGRNDLLRENEREIDILFRRNFNMRLKLMFRIF